MVEKSAFYKLNLDEQFREYFAHARLAGSPEKVAKFMDLIAKVRETFPELKLEFRWYQPMFLLANQGENPTFIASFTVAKNWINFAAENFSQNENNPEIVRENIQHTPKLVQFTFAKWDTDFAKNWNFISRNISRQIAEKRGSRTFWK